MSFDNKPRWPDCRRCEKRKFCIKNAQSTRDLKKNFRFPLALALVSLGQLQQYPKQQQQQNKATTATRVVIRLREDPARSSGGSSVQRSFVGRRKRLEPKQLLLRRRHEARQPLASGVGVGVGKGNACAADSDSFRLAKGKVRAAQRFATCHLPPGAAPLLVTCHKLLGTCHLPHIIAYHESPSPSASASASASKLGYAPKWLCRVESVLSVSVCVCVLSVVCVGVLVGLCAVCKTVQIFAQATRINANVNELTVNLAPKFLQHSLRLNLRFLLCILLGEGSKPKRREGERERERIRGG